MRLSALLTRSCWRPLTPRISGFTIWCGCSHLRHWRRESPQATINAANLRLEIHYLSSEDMPFFFRAEILDKYSQCSSPNHNPAMLHAILDLFRSAPEIKDYFFRGASTPNPSWAPILWDYGFLEHPPQALPGVHQPPRWVEQEFLISVADQVPELVVKHVLTLDAPSYYHSGALRALCSIPWRLHGTCNPERSELAR